MTGGGADSRPMEALAIVTDLLERNSMVINVQVFPFERAAKAHCISRAGHRRSNLNDARGRHALPE